MGLRSKAHNLTSNKTPIENNLLKRSLLAKARGIRDGSIQIRPKARIGLLQRALLQRSSEDYKKVVPEISKTVTVSPAEDVTNSLEQSAIIQSESSLDIQKELDKKLLDFTNIFEISKEVNSTLNIDELFSILIFATMGQFGVKQVSIFALDGNCYMMKAQRGADVVEGVSFNKESDFIGILVNKEEPCSLDSFESLPESESLATLRGMKLIVPLQNKGSLSGFVVLGERFSGDDFSNDEIGFLSTMASMAAIAIDNARLYTNLEKKLNEFSALYDISKIINSTGTLEEVANLAVETLTTGFGLEQAAFLSKKNGGYRILSSIGLDSETIEKLYFDFEDGLINSVFEIGEAIDISDFRDKPELVDLISVTDVDSFQSFLIIPLLAAGEKVGVLLVFSVKGNEENSFTSEAIQLFSIIASQLAPPIQMAEMFEKEKNEAVDPYSPYLMTLHDEFDNAVDFSLSLGVGEIKLSGFTDDLDSALLMKSLGELGKIIKQAVGLERKVIRTAVNEYSVLFPAVSVVDQEEALEIAKKEIESYLKKEIGSELFETSISVGQLPEDYASPEVYELRKQIVSKL